MKGGKIKLPQERARTAIPKNTISPSTYMLTRPFDYFLSGVVSHHSFLRDLGGRIQSCNILHALRLCLLRLSSIGDYFTMTAIAIVFLHKCIKLSPLLLDYPLLLPAAFYPPMTSLFFLLAAFVLFYFCFRRRCPYLSPCSILWKTPS